MKPSAGKRPAGRRLVRAALPVLLFLAAVLATGFPAPAQERTGLAAGPQPLAVIAAVPRRGAPRYGVDRRGRPQGFAIDVLEEIAARAGLTVTFLVKDSLADAEAALKDGQADLVPNAPMESSSQTGLAGLAFSAPVETFDLAFFVRDDTFDLEGIGDLDGRRLAVVESSVGHRLFKDRRDLNVKVYRDAPAALLELVTGYVDALVHAEPEISWLLKAGGNAGRVKPAGRRLQKIKRAMRLRMADGQLTARLNKAIGQFVGTPVYRRIHAKWYGEAAPYWTAARAAGAVGGLLGLVLLAMVGWRHHTVARLNRALKESGERYARAVAGTQDGFWEWDIPAQHVFYSPRWRQLAGCRETDPEPTLKTFEARLHPDDADRHARALSDHLENKAPYDLEIRLRGEDGDYLWVRARGQAAWNERGDPIRLTGSIADIGKRRKAEKSLRQSIRLTRALESRLQDAIDNVTDGIVLYGSDDRLILCNRNFRDFYGYSEEEAAPGVHCHDLGRWDMERRSVIVSDEFKEEYVHRRDGGTAKTLSPFIVQLKDGRWLETRDYRTKDGSTISIQTDITERRRAEEALRAANEDLERRVEKRTGELTREIAERGKAEKELDRQKILFESVFRDSPDAMVLADPGRNITMCNPAMTELFGYRPEDLLGKTISVLYQDQEEFQRHRRQRDGMSAEARLKPYLVNYVRKNGETFPGETVGAPIHDEAGNVLGFIGIVRDISEREMARQELVSAKLEAESASRVKSEFLANMSHELRTPLNAIIGFSDTMREQVFGPISNKKYEDYVHNIYESGEHLMDLINDVLDVSVIESARLKLDEEDVDIAELAQASLRLVRMRAEKGGVWLVNKVGDWLPRLNGDARRLKQILLNLLDNAIKFTPENGQVTLDAEVRPDGTLAITVTDTGIGMSPEEKEDAMVPFGHGDPTLSRKHEGSGLGLTVTTGLVEAHGGTLEIDSASGQGTTVTVRFPAKRVTG